jgi:uncharacterized repeat protein (TIGR03803 family)
MNELNWRKTLGATMKTATLAVGIVFLPLIMIAPPAEAQTFSVLYTFTGGADGDIPASALTADTSGNLYGTTAFGGNTTGICASGPGCGVVFKVDPAGNESVLYAFSGGYDGGPPTPGLVMDSSGNLYGTTYYGGGAGNGVVFKIDPAGQETVLLAFQEDGASGSVPGAGLIRDAEGNLYGTTIYAGPGGGCGYVFRLSQAGTETVLKDFGHGLGGCNPNAMLLEYQGSLYGTTVAGGANGHGVVFKRLSSQPSLDHRPPPGQSRW